MIAGHFGLAAAVKSRQPQVPLWSLMLATQLLDVVFVVLYFLKIENIAPAPGTAGNYGDLLGGNIDWSHSLVGALGIGLVAGVLAMPFWGRRTGVVIAGMVFSHWVLDLVVHRPDLAILPGNAGDLPRIGLGVWQWPWASIAIELALVLVGAYLYYHAAMRSAVRAERQEAKVAPGTAGYSQVAASASARGTSGYRQQALVASAVMLVLLVGTLVADVLVPFQQ